MPRTTVAHRRWRSLAGNRRFFSRAAVPLGALLGLASLAGEAQAQSRPLARLGISPGEPQNRSAQPSLPFGLSPATSKSFVLDFHGYLLMPLTLGLNQRENPVEGQGKTVVHNPPQVPINSRNFSHTGVIPAPYAQLNFSYGNRLMQATLILAAENFTDATGLFNPVEQLGAKDAFLTLNLSETVGTPLEVRVGAYTGRYGVMGAHDLGRYGTPLIARTNTVGESITAGFSLGEGATLVIEQGLGGQLGKPTENTVPSQYNDFAFTEVGATFVAHAHAGVDLMETAQFGLHYLYSWTRDDTASTGLTPDGSIGVFGADARLLAGRFGHLYLGLGHTTATNAGTVSGAIEVLNARGGPELMQYYLGPNSGGDGSLTTIGAQYDLSVSRLLFADRYQGLSPDILVSIFGMNTSISSDDPDYDGNSKLKIGAEVAYNALSWFGVSGRFDHVSPGNSSRESFNVITPRVFFHSDWQSQMEVALSYSHFIYGGEFVLETGNPPTPNPLAEPDADVIALTGWFWW